MEIERKYLISSVPFALSSYPCRKIEQGYLSTAPVVRIRRDNNDYILTYKSKGMMIREEYNLPLTKESYEHLKEKIDGRLITKKRYVIPLKDSLFIELDIFSGDLAPLMKRLPITLLHPNGSAKTLPFLLPIITVHSANSDINFLWLFVLSLRFVA